jgi:beta-lactam-binding protein with PASTA domain
MLVLVLAGVFGVSLFLESYTKHSEFIEVPDFDGFHYSEIEDYISDKDLRFEISDSIFDPSKEGGIVVEQLPQSGEQVKSNRKIYLTINSITPPSVTLPELRDITVRQVVSKIHTYGLKVDSLVYKPAECDNCVIGVLFEGEEILPGAMIEKGKSITLIIGEGIGTKRVPIPYLYRLGITGVKSLLNSQGLNMGFPEYDTTIVSAEDSMNAFVYKQVPVYDSVETIRQGTAFDLFLTLDSNKLEGIQLIVADTTVTEKGDE